MVQSIGIDTIRIQITDSPKNINSFLAECTLLEKNIHSHQSLPYTEIISNPYLTTKLSLQFSVPKVARDCEDNTCLACPLEVAVALRKIQERTGFDTFNATLPRIDITLCFESKDHPLAYADLWRGSKYFDKNSLKYHSIVIKRDGYEIILYDKGSEMSPKGEYLYQGHQITRIELRVDKRAKAFVCGHGKWKHKENGEFYVRSLTTELGFITCLKCFKKVVKRDLKLKKIMKASGEVFQSIRCPSLYKSLAGSDKHCENALTELCEQKRISEGLAQSVISDLRAFRAKEKLNEHARQIDSLIESFIG